MVEVVSIPEYILALRVQRRPDGSFCGASGFAILNILGDLSCSFMRVFLGLACSTMGQKSEVFE